jgi:hypothetical protein
VAADFPKWVVCKRRGAVAYKLINQGKVQLYDFCRFSSILIVCITFWALWFREELDMQQLEEVN